RPRPAPSIRGVPREATEEAGAREPRALARLLRRLHHLAVRILRRHVRRLPGGRAEDGALRRVGESGVRVPGSVPGLDQGPPQGGPGGFRRERTWNRAPEDL